MKRKILYILIFGAINCFFQNNKQVDTIWCTSNNTSYVIFPKKVDLVNVGNPNDYFAQIEERSVFIKAAKDGVKPSTLLFKIGDSYHFGVVAFKGNNKDFFFQSSKVTLTSEPNDETKSEGSSEKTVDPLNLSTKSNNNSEETNVSKSKENEIATSKFQMKKLEEINGELTLLGFVSKFISASVVVIRNDNKNTYLKIKVKNSSSIPYKLDFISFQYFQHFARGMKKGRQTGNDVFPIGTPTVTEIPSQSSATLIYAIPSFGLSDKGYLLVLFRENSGDRILKIKIDGEEIQRAPVLN